MVPGSDQLHNLRAVINAQKGVVKIKADMVVVADEDLKDKFSEVPYTLIKGVYEAKGKDVKIGDVISVNVTPKDFGRIAVQTARQTMQQRIRRAEQEMLAEEFKDRIGEVVTGTVKRYDKGDVIVDVEKYEGIVPGRQRIPGEEYNAGDTMRFYVLDVSDGPRGHELILSRSHPELVRRLFENEVIEIAEHSIEIVNVVRDAGYRTKVIVRSNDENVDPIGACVGIRGSRVKNVVSEINHEKVDVLEYSEDKRTMVKESLEPIEPVQIDIDDVKKIVTVYVADDKAAARAKGRRGQNVRLTARLISIGEDKWDVRVDTWKGEETEGAHEQVREAAAELEKVLEVPRELAVAMVQAGFTRWQDIAEWDVQKEDLMETLGISEQLAEKILQAAKNA